MKELQKLLAFYNVLQDEESKRIFEIKLNMLMKQSKYSDFIDVLISMDKEWEIAYYDNFKSSYKEKPIIIFGAGSEGKLTLHILKKMGIDIWGFCDNASSKWKTKYEGKPVISPTEVIMKHKDKFVILASMNNRNQFYNQLTAPAVPFPKENIWIPRTGTLYATNGQQYFDCPGFKVEQNEVFIDAGCFDGNTSKDFVKWCGGKYKKIYAFEPDRQCYLSCIKLNEELKNFNLLNIATWCKKELLHFSMNSNGSSLINKNGEMEVEANSIDNILDGEIATFIKMDVEGAEYNTILGAKETIKKYKPKLAVSIYHKEEDIFEIPLLLTELRDDYKFYIRHYTTSPWETVLYAI
jgi:FkbM family methyltransferase